MKRRLAIGLLSVLAVLLLLLLGNIAREWESKPALAPSPTADAHVQRMWDALNEPAWQATGAVSFTFEPGTRRHLWDRERAFDRVEIGDTTILVNLDDQSGRAFEAGREVFGDERDAALQRGYRAWINDAFWLAAPFKAMDPGTVRSDSPGGFTVAYTSGCLPPGDSYGYELADDGTPRIWKLWVSVIPLPGLDVSFDRWETLSTGARLPTERSFPKWPGVRVCTCDVRGAATAAELNDGVDPFAELIAP